MRRRSLARFWSAPSGAAAVEFTLLAPVYILLLTAAVDFGMYSYNKFQLDDFVSAAGNYAILNASQVGSSGGSALAQNLGLIVANGYAANWANVTITVNNGPVAILNNGILTTSGTAGAADSCYCPTPASGGVTWGSTMTCGALCPNGGVAGKFVSIVATAQYNSIFGSTGVMPSGRLGAATVVETN